MNKLYSTKNRIVIILVGPPRPRSQNFCTICKKLDFFNQKNDKIYVFRQHYQTLYVVMQREIENVEFVQGLKLLDSLKNNGTKYLLIRDNSCEEICNSKAFVDIATSGRHCGLNNFYIEHNLFHQSRIGRDVELQITHIVLFESPRDMM